MTKSTGILLRINNVTLVLLGLFLLSGCQSVSSPTLLSGQDLTTRQTDFALSLNTWEKRRLLNLISPENENLKTLVSEVSGAKPPANVFLDLKYRIVAAKIYWQYKSWDTFQSVLQESLKRYPTSPELLALQTRLEKDPTKIVTSLNKILALDPENGFVQFELGIILFDQGDYKQSAVLLDEALHTLPEEYTTLYGVKRDNALALATTQASGAIGEWLSQKILTLEGLVRISLGESSRIREVLGNNANPKAQDLKEILSSKEFFQGIQDSLPGSLTRGETSLFLWKTYLVISNQKNLEGQYFKKYSNFKVSGMPILSPVPDLRLEDPWFDSALGLVEREVMDLPDGINFFPKGTVSGMEFQKMLKAWETLF